MKSSRYAYAWTWVVSSAASTSSAASRRGTAHRNGHFQRINGKARLQMRVERPADHAPAEHGEHDRPAAGAEGDLGRGGGRSRESFR